MKFTLFASSLITLASLAISQTSAVQVAWDPAYGKGSGSLDTVACSDGANGLITRFGFKKFSDVPTFPNIGGAPSIKDWNSTSCGTCWQISFKGKNITMTALDVGGSGFVVSEAALNTLTNGTAAQVGVIDATAKQVNANLCGL